MSDYWQMLRLDLHKLVNYFVEVRRTPKKLVSYFLFLAWLMLLLLPSLKNRSRMTFNLSPGALEMVLGVYVLFLSGVLFSVAFSSLKKLSYKFSMGDVNLLFPSPLEPNRILFWSLLKKIPLTFLQSVLPVLLLTPTLLNLGLRGTGIAYVYASIVLFALLISPLSFLIFLLSVRYRKVAFVRAVLAVSAAWLVGSWLWQAGQSPTIQGLLTGYLAPGFWNFPVIGWVLQLAHAAFWGAGSSTGVVLVWALVFLAGVNFLVYRLAKDYYEDVLDYAALVEDRRERKRKGTLNLEGLTKLQRHKKVVVKGYYVESKAFLFKEIVHYRRTGFNEYLGYATVLAVLAGLAVGAFALKTGMGVWPGFFMMNGIVVYLQLLRGAQGPLGAELSLPYFYTLPGTFLRKTLAVNLLPTLRFTLNVLLLNLSYALLVGLSHVSGPGGPPPGIQPWLTGVFFALVVASVYFEQGNTIVLGHVLLPSDLDRKIFYPLFIFVQILVVLIPAGLVGGVFWLVTRSTVLAVVGIIGANLGMGILLLFLSGRIFGYVEMREFGAD
ncbi:hypothetical protein CEB3_c17430 [Peptococcaceae bacterium CEB3]|nr:hypothetical protein CEB3_c17430 [Peptococcaceae bacterium CEB3]